MTNESTKCTFRRTAAEKEGYAFRESEITTKRSKQGSIKPQHDFEWIFTLALVPL